MFSRFRSTPLFALLFAAVSAASGRSYPPLPREAVDSGYKHLVFEDQFDRLELVSKWHNGLWYDHPSPSSKIEVKDGHLRLTSKDGDGRGKGTNLHTLTRKGDKGLSTTFLHGYFEARMRVSEDELNWGAFWLEAVRHTGDTMAGPWVRYCEIDIAEFGPGRDVYYVSVHDWVEKKSHKTPTNSKIILPDGTKKNEWNRYGLLWIPGRIQFFVNGKLMRTIDEPAQCAKERMFLVLTSSKHGAEHDQSADFDWIRVYGR